jgi:hypothetical protein
VPVFRFTAAVIFMTVAVLAARPGSVGATGPGTGGRMRVDPAEIKLGMFYGGAVVRVEAAVPAGFEAAVVCAGKEGRLELKKKGKVWGILWMNVGEVIFENVPSVYVLSTSEKLADLAEPSVLEDLGVGYPALESRALPSPGGSKDNELFGELLKLKESEQLFSIEEGGVELEPGPGETFHVSARCFLPAKTPVGEIAVRLYGFSGHRGKLLDSARLRLSFGGATAFISSLAGRHGILYGILAVVIAIVVGLVTGFVFGLGSKQGH